MKIRYEGHRFAAQSRATIVQANEILEEYSAQGYDLTLRQLYYQFVSRGLIPNRDREYKKLGSVVNDARMAGLIDWDHIVDRTRNLRATPSWDSPSQIMNAVGSSYKRDLWDEQPYYVEVWIEKDALVGVIERPCSRLRVPYFSCRGYTSQSEMWGAAQRFYRHAYNNEQKILVIHLGDHDPSGIDMSRDIDERIFTFMANDYYRDTDCTQSGATDWATNQCTLKRIALNWDQVQQYSPPPNPAKLTDSRGAGYVDTYGDESWELDALEPSVIGDLITDAINEVLDLDAWEEAYSVEEDERALLHLASTRWADVASFLTTSE